MDGAMIIVPTKGEPSHVEFGEGQRPTLRQIQAVVGGPIELVPAFDRVAVGEGDILQVRVYCHEEGKLRHLPLNPEATVLWALSCEELGVELNDALFGDVAILMGTSEFLKGVE